jgi:hypothetical protein
VAIKNEIGGKTNSNKKLVRIGTTQFLSEGI